MRRPPRIEGPTGRAKEVSMGDKIASQSEIEDANGRTDTVVERPRVAPHEHGCSPQVHVERVEREGDAHLCVSQ